MKKNVGVLMPVASLPSRHGIGDFGYSSFKFIDWLKKNHYRYWQLLPINPLGPGESPYMSTSSSALDFSYISLDLLIEEGLLDSAPDFRANARDLVFYKLRDFKKPYLYKAYKNFVEKHPKALIRFKEQNPWVSKFATFQVFKEANGLRPWWEWPKWQMNYFNEHSHTPREYSDQIQFVIFMQYIALKQWKKVLKYAHDRGIKIICDVPFYVGLDSMEVLYNRDQFLLDENDMPTLVAGVPPDYFSEEGQLWGNPIYNFDKMRENNFELLVNRIDYLSKLCDIVRIDHFRAFDTYYVIPNGMRDAKIGEWRVGPRYEFFNALYARNPKIELIAEDLGQLAPGVYELRDGLRLPGMFIVEFSILDNAKSNENMIVYSGTHDNETLYGWFKNLKPIELETLKKNLNYQYGSLYNLLMRYVFSIPSKFTIVPLQDLLKLDNKARINTPSTVGWPNWVWRLRKWEKLDKVIYPKKAFFRKRNWDNM